VPLQPHGICKTPNASSAESPPSTSPFSTSRGITIFLYENLPCPRANWTQGTFFSVPKGLFLALFLLIICAPLPTDALPTGAFPVASKLKWSSALVKRTVQLLSVDNASDSWSDLVSGIAPLVLLVGERVTKQHLRESMTRVEYYMLGASPFGLITSMVSVLRLSAIPFVTRLIGRSYRHSY
jgi:hypothetical protein